VAQGSKAEGDVKKTGYRRRKKKNLLQVIGGFGFGG
jgi:hypothetical protein